MRARRGAPAPTRRRGRAVAALSALALTVLTGAAAVRTAPPEGATSGPGQRFGVAEPPPRHAGAVRVATYNLLNLFDHRDDPALSGPHDDLVMAISDDRCRALAAAIGALDADVLAVQEVESLGALTWFRDTYLGGMGYDHVVSEDVGDARGIECAILSRFPLGNVRTWPDLTLAGLTREGDGWATIPPGAPSRYQRSPLRADVIVADDYRLTLFVVHHKSGRDFDHQREAEALMTSRLIEAARRESPGRNIIVLGDFNAAPWDKSVRVYLAGGFVDTLAHRTTSNSAVESRRYRTHESQRVLDYILLDGAAFREYIPGSAFVLGTLHPGDDYDFRTDAPPPGYASDHYPVAIELMPMDRR